MLRPYLGATFQSEKPSLNKPSTSFFFFPAVLEEIAASSVEHHDEADLRFGPI